MDDLDLAVIDAWNRLSPTILDNPAELQRRLARRRSATMRSPPRAMCLSVRASDRRLHTHAALLPEDAVDPDDLDYPGYEAHDCTLDAHTVRTVCRAVQIPWPGWDWWHLAGAMGVHHETLRRAMRKGAIHVRRVTGLGGKPRSNPVPVVYLDHPLDPSSSNLWQPPDPVWGAVWKTHADRVPDDLRQTLRRVPVEVEYPRQDGTVDLRFRGWRFICPGCGRPVRNVYYPLPVMDILTYFGIAVEPSEADAVAAPLPAFACVKCHKVRYFSRVDRNSWNQLVTHLSAGLLYGHEVEKPAWLTPDRKRAYRPRKNRRGYCGVARSHS